MLQAAEHFRQMNNHSAEFRFLKYAQSNKCRNVNDSSVSYAAGALFINPKKWANLAWQTKMHKFNRHQIKYLVFGVHWCHDFRPPISTSENFLKISVWRYSKYTILYMVIRPIHNAKVLAKLNFSPNSRAGGIMLTSSNDVNLLCYAHVADRITIYLYLLYYIERITI